MALTLSERRELQELQKEEASYQKNIAPSAKRTPEEEAELVALQQEEAQYQSALGNDTEQAINPNQEADLGTLLRAQYSLEPLETNRIALLVEKLGQQNVKQDPETGEVYVRQNGEFRPVNVEGFSVADVSDFLGATPEMLGAGAGAIFGAGPGSIPGAIAGGMAGSGIRQGLSALLGTPQEASKLERAAEIGLSGAFGGGGAVLGKGVKSLAKNQIPALKAKLFEEFKTTPFGESLKRISKTRGIPSPTPGQLEGGKELLSEKELAFRPFFGRKIRKQVDAQTDKIKQNLADQVGDFIEIDSDRAGAALGFKGAMQSNIKAVKQTASQLFDTVAEGGKKIKVQSADVADSLISNFKKLGLVDDAGNFAAYDPENVLTEAEFGRVQKIANDILRSVTKNDDITAYGINQLRRNIDRNIKEGTRQSLDNVVLIKMRNSFMDLTEDMLKAGDRRLAKKFRKARALWGRYLDMDDVFRKGGQNSLENTPEDVLLKKVFSSGLKEVRKIKGTVTPDQLEKAATAHLNDKFSEILGKEGKRSGRAAFKYVQDRREMFQEVLGKEKYLNLRDNLRFLDYIGEPINPSGTGIMAIINDLATPSTWIASGLLTGRNALKKVNRANIKAALRGFERAPERSARIMQMATDPYQRETSRSVRGPKEMRQYGQRN